MKIMIKHSPKIRMLFLIAMCLSHAYADAVNKQVFTYVEALAKCDELNLKSQTPETDGRIQTLNKKGAVTAKPDYATLEFLKYAKSTEFINAIK